MSATKEKIRKLTPIEIRTLEEIATSVKTLETEYMENRVFDLSLKASGEDDGVLAGTYRFLAGVLRPRVERLADIHLSTNQFWVIPATLTEEEIDLLKELVAGVSDPELRSRFGDFLWLKTGDRMFGETAVDDYLASALRLRDPENWPGCARRYKRAVTVAASLGKKNARYLRAIETVEQYVTELNGEDPLFLSEHLISILLEQRRGDISRYAALTEKCARAAEARDNFDVALHYWNLKVRCHAALNDPVSEQQARVAAAESVVSKGESYTAGEGASFLAAADCLQRGVAMMQKVGASPERIAELATRLKIYQKKGLDELESHHSKFDATEMINEARAAVSGKELREAIVSFIELPHLPKRENVRQQVLQAAKDFPMSHMFGEIHLDSKGAAIAGRGSVSGDEAGEPDNVLKLMYQDVVQGFSIQAQTTIGPAWRQIQDEHGIREQDMSVIVHQSWFIPPALETVFALGLAAGFNGDLLTSIYLLVPQIEPTIRWHLQRRGVITMRVNRDGYQEERDLNQLLALPEAKEFLNDRVHFALTAILTSRFGYYLRHKLAHGLIDPRECSSTVCLFFWALVLLVCVRTCEAGEPTETGK